LERRELLAADTILVNFQFDEAASPNSYVRDVGAVFGDRGNGWSYGWTSDHTNASAARGLLNDVRLDTLIGFRQGQSWELQLPGGEYEVTAVVGDPANDTAVHTLNVEGVNFFDGAADTGGEMLKTMRVTVADGRLTLDSGAAAEQATRLNYLHVVGVASGNNASPATPTITEPEIDGQIVNPTDAHLEAVGFGDSDGDAHRSSDWEIWTTGGVAQRVWFTLGTQGVERLHSHLGDGYFENSHAGRLDLLPNTDYEVRVRFRDSAGSVSDYATRRFRTGSAFTVFPLEVEDVAAAPAPAWLNLSGAAIDLPAGSALLSPGDAILAIDTDGGSAYPGNESPQNAIDGTLNKYLNFGKINSGFIVTPPNSGAVVSGFQITTANDAQQRDPTTWQLFGTNDPIASVDNSTGDAENWTLIDAGVVALPSARNTLGPLVPVDGDTAYASYRMLFTGVKDTGNANSMQIGEIQFFGDLGLAPAPPSLRLESAAGQLLLKFAGIEAAGNVVTNPATLAEHVAVRVVVEGGTAGFRTGASDLVFSDDDGQSHTVFLPAINLAGGQELILWISLDGSTYYGQASQTEPDFTLLARSSQLALGFIATQPGYVVEEVAGGFQLPVNVAFVPNPGPAPDNPLFYVNELYGTIKVVTNDGTVGDYASGLLNFNPTGNFPGSGEQGLTGLVVDPATGDVIVTRVTDTDGLPGGAHHPQVLRLTSNDGGLTSATQTVLLDMVGESQGQSHQISNLSIGPDGKLYVHNGDGFDASTALNLDSYRGKILRLNLDGTVPSDNVFYNAADGINSRDYIYAYGFRNPFGGAWRASDGVHYEVENGPSIDRFARVVPGGNYLWDGSNASMLTNSIYNWDPAHAPVNITFVQPETFNGSRFPAQVQDRAFVSESGPTYAQGPQSQGKRIVSFQLDAAGNVVGGPETLVEYVGEGRATVVGLASGPDGLYFTDLYRDVDAQSPIDAGARVLRVRYVGGAPGDFNLDGNIDGGDLQHWQAGFGAHTGGTVATGDADGDLDVDGFDFLRWQREFAPPQGQPAVAGATADGALDAALEDLSREDPDTLLWAIGWRRGSSWVPSDARPVHIAGRHDLAKFVYAFSSTRHVRQGRVESGRPAPGETVAVQGTSERPSFSLNEGMTGPKARGAVARSLIAGDRVIADLAALDKTQGSFLRWAAGAWGDRRVN
jgi:glucose/arabinose dehydrogenase